MSPSINSFKYKTANRPAYRGLQISAINVFMSAILSLRADLHGTTYTVRQAYDTPTT